MLTDLERFYNCYIIFSYCSGSFDNCSGALYGVVAEKLLFWPLHDDVIKWKHFPRYWPFVRGIHRSPVNSPHKGQWRGALIFPFICAWINGWVNIREAGDLRRHRAHYDVIVMLGITSMWCWRDIAVDVAWWMMWWDTCMLWHTLWTDVVTQVRYMASNSVSFAG